MTIRSSAVAKCYTVEYKHWYVPTLKHSKLYRTGSDKNTSIGMYLET